MKKLLSFLLIISFVFAAFAVKPATNYSVAEFSGNATLEYKGSINEDADGKGQSILTKSLFYAKLYLSLLIFKMVSILSETTAFKSAR